MADNNEASGIKPFWQVSQEMEELPRRDVEEDDTDPEYTTDGAIEDDTTDGPAEDDTTNEGERIMNTLLGTPHSIPKVIFALSRCTNAYSCSCIKTIDLEHIVCGTEVSRSDLESFLVTLNKINHIKFLRYYDLMQIILAPK
jgi:hypothetical protein